MQTDDTQKINEVERVAKAALGHASQYRTPLWPKCYEIWYAYEEGNDNVLRSHIDDIIHTHGRIPPEEIESIHDRFFSTRSLEAGVSNASNQISSRLDVLITDLAGGINRSDEFGERADAISRKISEKTEKSAIEALAQQLISLSNKQTGDARKMREELETVRGDFLALKAQLQALQEDAFRDHLTKLSNRRRLDAVVDAAIEHARENGETLAFALADIDHFKKVNDTWGHASGDKVLQRFADLLQKSVKGQDTVARYGGEEFAIVLPKTSLSGAHALSDQIRQYFSAMRFVARETGQRLGRVTASFGVTILREHDDASSLMARADQLLYQAKDGGRNLVKSAE